MAGDPRRKWELGQGQDPGAEPDRNNGSSELGGPRGVQLEPGPQARRAGGPRRLCAPSPSSRSWAGTWGHSRHAAPKPDRPRAPAGGRASLLKQEGQQP